MAAIAYDPDDIYLCSSRFSFLPEEIERMQNRLNTSVGIGAFPPKLHAVYNPEMEAMSGIISRVISDWLDSMIVPKTRKKQKSDADTEAETPTLDQVLSSDEAANENGDT